MVFDLFSVGLFPVSQILYFQVHNGTKSPDFTERVELSAEASTLT